MASNPAVTEKGDERDDNDGNGTDELVVARPATMEPIPVVSVPGLDVARRRDMMHSPRGTPERFPPFPRNAESKGSPMSERHLSEPTSELQDLLNNSKDKAGLCIICSCANPQQGQRILECTAPQKMTKCFGNDLGFSIREYSDLSIERMHKLLNDVGSLKIPQFCVKNFRFFFYFFGHGNEKEICLTDGNFQRHEIVSKVQKFDEDKSLCKVLLIDSCRHKTQQLASATQENTNLEHGEIHGEPVKASETERGKSVMALGDDSEWEEREAYPESINTLVIYSTFRSSEALYVTDRYQDMRGCGVMTYFFTQLASMLNQPLSVVLTKVREKVAIFIKEVEPSLSPQVLVFDHFLMVSVNLLAESKGAERVKPEIVGVHTTTTMITTVQWEFQLEDQERVKLFTLSCRDVQGRPVDIEEVPSAMKNVRDFKNAFLVPDKVYMITVLAVYEDGFKSESEAYQFTSISRGCPNEITITPVLSDRTKATLWWKFSGDDKDISKFLVEVDNQEGATVDPCYREANISELKPYFSHAVRVIAVFKDEYRTESKIISYTIPTEDQMKPVITCDESKHSTFLVTVSSPPVIQQFPNDNNIQLERVKVWRVPCGVDSEDESFESCEISNKNELKEPTQNVKLAGSIPGKDYNIICKMEYTTGDVLKNETLFSSAKPQCCQRIFYSPKFIIVSFFAMILLSFLFSVSYIPYSIYLKGSTEVQTHYASTNTTIDCGTGNSRTHNGINLEGSLQRGDTLDSVINAWLVRRDKLKLYSQKAGPYIDGYRPLPGDHTVQLSGWNVYLWVRSIISGYCCVQNENGTERTASIFLFTSFDDSLNFRSGGHAENYILTETLTIPQGYARCFSVFGQDKPLTVNESSYHIFIVQLSANNMNFSSEVNYLQNYVNTSDYSHPHEFQYDSQTHLQFPTGPEHPTDYIAICKAPDTVPLGTAHPEAEYIHIKSWGSHYWWKKGSLAGLIFSLVVFFTYCPACVCFCLWHYFRKQCSCLLNSCSDIKQVCSSCFCRCMYRCRDGYTSVN